jgi:predicted RNase H-like HicB family nuclease
MSLRTFTAYVEFDPETKLYVGTIPSLPGAHSQGATLDELQHNLQEVIALCLEERAASHEAIEPDDFVGIQKIAVDA